MSTVSKPRTRSVRRDMNNIAVIGSGGHTFTVDRRIFPHDDRPLEIYTVGVPREEGSLRIVRCGLHNDGPFGLEFEFDCTVALPTDRAIWWAHALHAAARFAERLNGPADQR